MPQTKASLYARPHAGPTELMKRNILSPWKRREAAHYPSPDSSTKSTLPDSVQWLPNSQQPAADRSAGSDLPENSPACLFADGVKILHDCHGAAVDICFVHGLTGNRDSTWTADGESRPWPETLLPQKLDKARILTYGYDAYFIQKGVTGSNRLIDHAANLLHDLTTDRLSSNASNRPLVFVAHSLGGLVCKQAILLSRSNPEIHLRGVFNYCRGVLFMGTPHKGSWMADWAKIPVSAMGLVKSTNKTLLEVLETSNQLLESIQVQFLAMVREQREKGRLLEVTCFFEELPLPRPLAKAVVTKESATLEGYSSISIHANHRDMVRFASVEDNGFKRVLGELMRWTTQRVAIETAREARRSHLWASLRFEQADARREDIRSAHADTCRWLLQDHGYLEWLDVQRPHRHSGIFWIKGKPGGGKSTLMNFAVTQAEKTTENRFVISHFFHARGIDLQKSTVGMYRSLLWQLLQKLPRPWLCFDDAGLVKDLDIPAESAEDRPVDLSTPRWTVERLKDLLKFAMKGVGKQFLFCFIDALDECDEGQIRDMMCFFAELTQNTTSLRICFASRHYPNITINRGLVLVLEAQKGHSRDIRTYIDTRLMIGHSGMAQEIRMELQEKASGVFMWVILVINMLQKDYDSGRIHALRQRLREIPQDLHELFHDIMTRDQLHLKELHLCIEWVLFARRPLTPEELYYGILSGIGVDAIQDVVSGSVKVTVEDMERLIQDCSKGLIEFVYSPYYTVQFIHETVRDFLLKADGLTELWSSLQSGRQDLGHNLLKQCCATYLAGTFRHVALNSRSAHSIRRRFPFLDYAARHVLQHADLAQGEHISQLAFMKNFERQHWLAISDLLSITDTTTSSGSHRVKSAACTLNASLLYICAVYDLPNLIEVHPTRFSYLRVEDEKYGTPLHASAMTGSTRALRKFMELETLRQPDVPLLRQLSDKHPDSEVLDWTFKRGLEAIDTLLGFQDGILVLFLLAAGQDLSCLCDRRTWYRRMVQAVLSRSEQFAEQFLDTGFELLRGDVGALICRASWEGWENVARKILPNCGPRINVVQCDESEYLGGVAVRAAFQEGNIGIAAMVVSTGSLGFDIRLQQGETLLSRAAQFGCTNVVRTILDVLRSPNTNMDAGNHDAENLRDIALLNENGTSVEFLRQTGTSAIYGYVNSKNISGRTALSYAAERGHAEIVSLLLQLDELEIDSEDERGMTPLLFAAEEDHHGIVGLLYEALSRRRRTPTLFLSVRDAAVPRSLPV